MSERQIPGPARAVADAPVAALLGRCEEIAKSWALALIAARPLGRAAEISLEALASHGPALCAQAVRALHSDSELQAIAAAGELQEVLAELGRGAGVGDVGSGIEAVEALRGVLWRELVGDLRDPSTRQLAELADRLARICAQLSGAIIAATQAPSREQAPPESLTPPESPAPWESLAQPEPLAPSEPLTAPEPLMQPSERFAPPEPPEEVGIEVRDTRATEGPAAWIGSIGRRLERHAEDRLSFAVLLVEVAEIERLAHAEPAEAIVALVGRVERALGQELRPADLLTREAQGRYWLVTPETDAIGARMLAERLARTVRASAEHRGVPLEVAIGIAVCPDDGTEASALAAQADVGVFEARAAGRAVSRSDPRAGLGEDEPEA